MNRDKFGEILERFRSEICEFRFLWRNQRDARGDVELDIPILEAFGVPAEEQRAFLLRTRTLRDWAASLLGKDVMLVQHTPEATREHYSDLFETIARTVARRRKPVQRKKARTSPTSRRNFSKAD